MYPTIIPEDLQETINEWFDLRHVCDDVRFPTYFKRQLLLLYPQYKELLRVQPGYAHYDWLVTMYQEQQTKSKAGRTTDDITNTTSAKEGTDTTNTEGETGKTGNVVVSDGGEETHTTEYGSANTKNGSEETTDRFNDYHETTDASDTSTYGKTTTSTPGVTSTQKTHYEDADGSQDVTEDGTQGVSKASPMSISYSSATAGEIPALNWEYPSAQQQEKGKSTTKHGQKNDTEVISYQSGSETTEDGGEDGRVAHSDTTKSGEASHETVFNDVKDEKSGADSQTSVFGKTVTTTYNGLSDTSSGSSSVTYDTKESTDSRSQGSEKTQSEGTLQSTGRNGSAAALIKEASEFIMASNAFEWLRINLEPCFWGIFDFDKEGNLV